MYDEFDGVVFRVVFRVLFRVLLAIVLVDGGFLLSYL
jgi:hypothetical protein